MSAEKKEGAKPEGDAAKPAAKEETGGNSGGFKAWLPLIVTIIIMPVLAVTTTKFLVLPKVVQARSVAADEPEGGHEESKNDDAKPEHGEGKEGKDHAKPKDGKEAGGKGQAKKKQAVPISKVIVNVAGSMGTRYLMTSFTLVGTSPEFKTVVEENKDQLLDLANSAMASKTIADLEKPGARNQLRAELMSIFNNALGANVVQEIYFTEFAIQ